MTGRPKETSAIIASRSSRREPEPTEVELAYLRLIEREPEMTKTPVAMAAN
jgi:hypothetical protein